MQSIGFALNQQIEMNINIILNAYSDNFYLFNESDINVWFENQYLRNQTQIFDTFNQKQELSWDMKFSQFNIR